MSKISTTLFSVLTILPILYSLPMVAQKGYTVTTGEAIWGGTGEHRNISLTGRGVITDGGEAFNLESLMPANPLNNSDRYLFDYKIKQHVTTPLYKGPIVYYVNSKDGSVAFTAEENPEIKRHIRQDLGDLHFGIRKTSGNLLICGLHKNSRTGRYEKRGIDLGKDHNVNIIFSEMLFDQMTWLNSAEAISIESLTDALTPSQIEIVETSSVDGVRGSVTNETGREQVIDLYFIPIPVLERVSVPFMGLNAGIMKNFKKKINQLVIYSVVRSAEWKGSQTNFHFYLDGLYRADAIFRPGEYSVITAFNKKGTADAQQLQQEFVQLTQRVKQLQQLIKNCPKGNEGKACREPYQRELKEIQAQLKQRADKYLKKEKFDE